MLPGKVTPSKLWSKSPPKVKVCRLLGKVTPFKLWLKPLNSTKIKVFRLLGKATPFKLWLKRVPRVKVCRLVEKVKPSKLRSNMSDKINETIPSMAVALPSKARCRLNAASPADTFLATNVTSSPISCCSSGWEWSRT